MSNSVVTSVFSSRIPRFIYGIDKEDNEYVLCTEPPHYLIKFNGVLDSEDEEEEDDDDSLSNILLKDKELENSQKIEFHIEIFKFTSSGLTPITYESKIKAVQNIISDAMAFYLEVQE